VGDRLVFEAEEAHGVDHPGDERERARADPHPPRQLHAHVVRLVYNTSDA
jgi:hypothetical protein